MSCPKGLKSKIINCLFIFIFSPILNVELVSVNSSILQSPSDCVLLPGGQLLILDSDAGFSLISLESKQMVKQLSPKQGIWRNAECACFDGENIYVGVF
jgi:hypothetical protein